MTELHENAAAPTYEPPIYETRFPRLFRDLTQDVLIPPWDTDAEDAAWSAAGITGRRQRESLSIGLCGAAVLTSRRPRVAAPFSA